MWAQATITHAMSDDVLVKGIILYPLKVIINFWGETTYYQP
jgi:hypothetical protein